MARCATQERYEIPTGKVLENERLDAADRRQTETSDDARVSGGSEMIAFETEQPLRAGARTKLRANALERESRAAIVGGEPNLGTAAAT